MFGILKTYFQWLQKDVPTGDVVRYPVIYKDSQTDVDGLFIVGDLSGTPLLKLSVAQGHNVIETVRRRLETSGAADSADVFDVAIVGGGAAGLAAGLHAKKSGLNYVVLEAARTANTIVNFPEGKPIFAEPTQFVNPSALPVRESNRETLLQEWSAMLERERLNIWEGAAVTDIRKKRDGTFVVTMEDRPPVFAKNVALATGKAGKARRLAAAGENLPKVSDRLFSPKDFHGSDILVVGGGDTAVETAIALAETGNRVTLSYRRGEFSRVKSRNRDRIAELAASGEVAVSLNSKVTEITESNVSLTTAGGETVTVPNDRVFAMIGRELPYEFLQRIGVAIEGAWTLARFALYSLAAFIFTAVYFGKHVVASQVLQNGEPVRRFSEWAAPALIVTLLVGVGYASYLRLNRGKLDSMRAYVAPTVVMAGTLTASLAAIWWMSGQRDANFLWGKHPGFWYSLLYTFTIVVFGVRRMKKNDWEKYVVWQTVTLTLIQVVPLFLVPELLPLAAKAGWIPSWLEAQAFPNGEYWRWYGFVLAYPLFIHNVLTGEPIAFWLIASAVQTFVVIPAFVYFFGKGAYCGWICSCGALAETLGDDYRALAPHGETAKRWENLGQIILLAIGLLTVAWGLTHWTPAGSWLRTTTVFGVGLPAVVEIFKHWYELIIDTGFAGAIGLGVYFFYSGRIWCRFGCPLAALMHVYAKFSRYRIFADKPKCISCNACTRACHMGIDVMGYASQGRPMDDVECVRCSACIASCPMDVLSFGMTGTEHPHDPASRLYQLTYAGTSKSSLAQR